MSEKNFDETMEMVENRIKESQASREGVELSNLEVSADGIREKAAAAIAQAEQHAEETQQRVEAAGGIEAVEAAVKNLPEDRKAYWTAKIQESLKKQSRAGNSGFGGGNEGFENVQEEIKQGYFIVRRFFSAGAK